MSEKNITFEIREHLGIITKFESGWNRELNIISWNGKTPKYDVRDWDPYHERMRKGLTFHEAEMRKLVDLYLNHNSQKAVESGRAREEERRARQKEQMERERALNPKESRFGDDQTAEERAEATFSKTDSAEEKLPFEENPQQMSNDDKGAAEEEPASELCEDGSVRPALFDCCEAEGRTEHHSDREPEREAESLPF